MNSLNHMDQKVERALSNVTLSQDAKYRVKNKIHSAVRTQRHTGRKLSSAAVIAVTLVSLLVITAAAIGISMFSSIYGEKADVLTPYGIAINTTAQNEDVVLTLHESVADDYATAYIFSIKGLTDAGKALVTSNTLDPNADETVFEQTNKEEIHVNTVVIDNYPITSVERTPPKENADCQLYKLHQQTNSDGEYVYFDIGLRLNNVIYSDKNNASYTIIPIESLREENREYYALYIVTPEAQLLTLTLNGLELSLPEATTRIPGTEVIFDGYIQDYYLTEGGLSTIMSDYPTSAVLTPLGLYVNDSHTRSVMYRYATLVFNDGNMQYLSDISNDKSGIASWKPRYLPTYYQGAVYLFNEIMDVSTVKSLVFNDEIEFPFDGSTPFVRSSGRVLSKKNAKVLLWEIAEKIHDDVVENCPNPTIITDPETNKSIRDTGWGDVQYKSRAYDNLYFGNSMDDSYFLFSLNETTGGSFEDEVCRKLRISSSGLKVASKGSYNGAEALMTEYGAHSLYRCQVFILYEDKLLCIDYHGTSDYAFNVLLKFIK